MGIPKAYPENPCTLVLGSVNYEQYSSGILLFLGYALVIFALLIWMIVAGSRANNKARG